MNGGRSISSPSCSQGKCYSLHRTTGILIFRYIDVFDFSAILTLLQVDTAASDPLIRSSALLSLVCALMSLLYACMYIVRFPMMRKAHKALEWAEVSSRSIVISSANTLNVLRKRRSMEEWCCGMSGFYSHCPPYGYHGEHLLDS
jgi:succinate dehydrogenase/fumarate reductase cytochrome b subunit